MWEFTGTPRFELRRKLGAGGIGAVYEVFDRERSQRVALKTLSRLRPEDVIRFKREFRTLSEIVNPRLIRLYELIGDGNHWLFTMELLEGSQPLLARPRPVQPTETASLTTARMIWAASKERAQAPELTPEYLDCMRDRFRQFAEGVAAIHQAGKLHRDLKPSNVMVKPDRGVIILDFGLTMDLRAAQSGTHAAALGSLASSSGSESWDSYEPVAGTIAYMAPEQALGGPLTEASDWYAFGATLYECLTGKRPFEQYGKELLTWRVAEDGPAPSLTAPGVPRDLDHLVELLLRRQPAQRPGANAVLAVLAEGKSAAAIPLAPRVASEFIGRERQLEALRTALDRLRLGRSGVIRVSGPSGFGKSALLSRFLEGLSAAPDAFVLTGRCYEQEAIPYKAADSVADSLALHLMGSAPEEIKALLPTSADALAQLFPVLLRVPGFPSGGAGEHGGLQERRREAFHGLREILTRLGERYRLVIAIDDIQWADADSALLLEEVFRPDRMPRALLICLHRSEYSGPFLSRLEALHPENLDVGRLDEAEGRELALRLLGGDPEQAYRASRIAEASGGSPYFIAELVRHARQGMAMTDNLDLDSALRRRVELLPPSCRQMLEILAVAGSPIELRSAHDACPEDVDALNAVAELRHGHLIRSSGVAGGRFEIETYHDRVREAILNGLSPAIRSAHHGRLATVLETYGRTSFEALAFHYEHGGFAEKAAALYSRAAGEAIRALALNRAETLLRNAARLAANRADRTAALERLVHLQTNAGHFKDAYATGSEAAREWGIRLPASFIPPVFAADLLQFAILKFGKRVERLSGYRQARDEGTEAAVRLMAAVGKAAYQVRPELCISVMIKIVNLCLRRGMTPDCAIGFMAVGAIFLGGILGRRRTGAEFGRLALRLVDRFKNEAQRAEVNFVVGYFATSWRAPAAEAEVLWRTALESGQASGDLFHTGCAACATVLGQFMRGVPLPDVWQLSEEYLELTRKYRLLEPTAAIVAVRQAIRNLRGETRSADSLDSEDFGETVFRTDLDSFGSRHFALFYHVARMQALAMRGLFAQTLETARVGAPFVKDARGMLHGAEYSFYRAFAALVSENCPTGEMRAARRTMRQFQRLARESPANFASRAGLLEAELARRHGVNASELYYQTMLSAESSGQLHLAGLAACRSGDIAAARNYFAQWGAPVLLTSLNGKTGVAKTIVY